MAKPLALQIQLKGGGDGAKPEEPKSNTASSGTSNRLAEFKNYLDLVTNKSDANTDLGYPGVRISTYSGSIAGISIDRQFDRPVIVGVKGVTLDYCDIEKGECKFTEPEKDIIKPTPPDIAPANEALPNG